MKKDTFVNKIHNIDPFVKHAMMFGPIFGFLGLLIFFTWNLGLDQIQNSNKGWGVEVAVITMMSFFLSCPFGIIPSWIGAHRFIKIGQNMRHKLLTAFVCGAASSFLCILFLGIINTLFQNISPVINVLEFSAKTSLVGGFTGVACLLNFQFLKNNKKYFNKQEGFENDENS